MKVQLATRLDTGLRQRLRIYAAVTGRTVEDVVGAALDGYLPPASDMVRTAASGLREDALLADQPGMA
jgi:plasmid stability protein